MLLKKLSLYLMGVGNIVEKGEHAGNQHFLLFPQCFQTAFSLGASKVVIVWERFNPFPNTPFCDGPKIKEAADDN